MLIVELIGRMLTLLIISTRTFPFVFYGKYVIVGVDEGIEVVLFDEIG